MARLFPTGTPKKAVDEADGTLTINTDTVDADGLAEQAAMSKKEVDKFKAYWEKVYGKEAKDYPKEMVKEPGKKDDEPDKKDKKDKKDDKSEKKDKKSDDGKSKGE